MSVVSGGSVMCEFCQSIKSYTSYASNLSFGTLNCRTADVRLDERAFKNCDELPVRVYAHDRL